MAEVAADDAGALPVHGDIIEDEDFYIAASGDEDDAAGDEGAAEGGESEPPSMIDEEEIYEEEEESVSEDNPVFAGAISSTAGKDGIDAQDCDPAHGVTEPIHRQLHLYRCPSVQQSIRRLWNHLPLDGNRELAMEGYIELNLRLQRSLGADFELQRAVDSAVGDWQDDVPEGRSTMTAEDFAMFLFELCSLWCGESVVLGTYLFFLNAMLLNVTEARGNHTVGLKPLDSVSPLPDLFHKALKGTPPAASEKFGKRIPLGERLGFQRCTTPEAAQETFRQVQRQVYQVLHDIRAIFLFKGQDGRPKDGDSLGSDLLGLALADPHQGRSQSRPPSMLRSASAGALETQSLAAASVISRDATPSFGPAWRRVPPSVQKARPPELSRCSSASNSSVHSSRMLMAVERNRQMLSMAPLEGSRRASSGSLGLPVSPANMILGSEEVLGPPRVWSEPQFLVSPPYKLPKACPDAYKRQWEPILRQKPGHVAYVIGNHKYEQSRGSKPFDRSLKRLPQELSPSEQGPVNGPMADRPDPLFPAMQSRLQTIMRKQGKRAERRRKRRLRSKLFHDRSKLTSKRGELFRDLVKAFDTQNGVRPHRPDSTARRPGQELGSLFGGSASTKQQQQQQRSQQQQQPSQHNTPKQPGLVRAKSFFSDVRSSLLEGGRRPMSLQMATQESPEQIQHGRVRPVYMPPPEVGASPE